MHTVLDPIGVYKGLVLRCLLQTVTAAESSWRHVLLKNTHRSLRTTTFSSILQHKITLEGHTYTQLCTSTA